MPNSIDLKFVCGWLGEKAPGFLFIFALSLVYAFPILMDGRYYLDDLPHAMTGLTLWEQDGRPLASIIASLASFQLPSFSKAALIDASPLPQILGLVALSFAAAKLAQNLFDQTACMWGSLVVFPLVASPFMLQNLSYKFDALTMGLAIMLAVLAALPKASTLQSIAALLAACCLYQAALNIFVATTALLCFAHTANIKYLLRKNVIALLAAAASYAALIYGLGGLATDYATAHSRVVSFNAEGFQSILFNFGFGNFFVMEAIADAPWLYALGLVAILIFIVQSTRTKGTSAGLLVFLSTLVMLVSIMGLLLLLAQPVVRPRTLLALSILMIAMGFAFYELVKDRPALWKAPLLLAAAWYFVLAYAYANAAHDQTRFEEYLASGIADALTQAGFKPNDKLAFDGAEPRSPIAENSSRLKTIARTLQLNMNGNSEWGFRQLEMFGLKPMPIIDVTEQSLKALCTDAPLSKADAYQLFKQADTYVISFANGVCFKP